MGITFSVGMLQICSCEFAIRPLILWVGSTAQEETFDPQRLESA